MTKASPQTMGDKSPQPKISMKSLSVSKITGYLTQGSQRRKEKH